MSVHQPFPLERLLAQTADLLTEARKQGASAAEAGINIDHGLSVTARMGEAETVEHHKSQAASVTVYFGQRKGSASSTDLSPDALGDTVRAACRIARHAAEDPYAGLPDADLIARTFPDLDLHHPWTLDTRTALDIAIACERAALGTHAEITNSEGAMLHSQESWRTLGNSLGLLHGYPASWHSLSCSVVGQRGGEMQRDGWHSMARRAEDLENAEAVGRTAAERALRRLGSRTLGTRQCPVLFAPEVATGLLRHFVGAIRGANLYRKSSFLLDSLGQAVFPDFFRLREDPLLPRAPGSAPYDDEGVATHPKWLVRDGVVESYLLGSYSARKLGLKSTGNAGGIHNLILEPGPLNQDDLLREMRQGLLVTELMGQGANPVTGDYSRGASGFWIEDGGIAYPVEGLTIAGNLKTMFHTLRAIGNDVDRRGSIHTGSILLAPLTIAGN